MFALTTEGLLVSPVLLQADLALVPRLMLVQEEHFIPSQATKSSGEHLSRYRTASLRCEQAMTVEFKTITHGSKSLPACSHDCKSSCLSGSARPDGVKISM